MNLKYLIKQLQLIDEQHPDNNFEVLTDQWIDGCQSFQFISSNPYRGTYDKSKRQFNLIDDFVTDKNAIQVVCLRSC